jgi:chromosome segregation ATPase
VIGRRGTNLPPQEREIEESHGRGRTIEPMFHGRRDTDEILAMAASAGAEIAPLALRTLQARLARLAAEVEVTRRRLEAIRPALAVRREQVAQLEAAEVVLQDARVRLRALEAAGPGLEAVRTRVRTMSPALESARRTLEATPPGMLPATRRQVRALATEIEAVSRTVFPPAPVLEALRAQVRALDALVPLLRSAREEVRVLEALTRSLETARIELRALATELEAPRRAVDAAVRTYG